MGTGLKKDEFVCNCSEIDDIIIFYRDGKYKVIRVAEKLFVGKNIIHVGVFKKNDKRTIYNVVYRDGKTGPCYIKRFNIPGIIRDRENDLTLGKPESRVMYFTANPNGEAEVIKVNLDPAVKRRALIFTKDFAEVSVKGRGSKGNLLTKQPVQRISLKSHGHSTLGGRKVWFDPDVKRLNYDEHGRLLGEFNEDDLILVILDNGEYYTTNFDVNNHYEDNIRYIEKYRTDKVWSAVVLDADNQGFAYAKRFMLDPIKKRQSFVSENPASRLAMLSDHPYPRVRVAFGGADSVRPPMEIEIEEFVGVKGYKAKGKRIAAWPVAEVEELEPTRQPEPEPEETPETPESQNNQNIPNTQNNPNPQNTPNPPEAASTPEPTIDEDGNIVFTYNQKPDESGQFSLFPDE